MDERRAQLVALGLSLFADRGYDELSIEEIARAAGISKGLLYHYFPSKRAFFTAAVREASRQLLADVGAKEPPENPDPGDILRRVDTFLAFVEQRSRPFVFLMRGQLGGDDEVRAIVDDTRRQLIERMVAGIGAALGPVTDRLRIAVRGWVGFVEAASLEWLAHKTVPRAALAEMLTQVCIATVQLALGERMESPTVQRAPGARVGSPTVQRAPGARVGSPLSRPDES